MSRLVRGKRPGASAFAGRPRGEAAREYGERVAKYVPAEIIAVYLTLTPVILSGTDDGTTRRTVLLAVVLGVGVVLTPVYLLRFAEEGAPKVLHLVIATIAFVVWAYGIGGFFTDIGWYDAVVAAVVVGLFSLVSGAFVPTQES